MVKAVNFKLPEEARIGMHGWPPGKYFCRWDEYRRLNPSATLLRQSYALREVGMLCWIAAAALLFQWV
jgi:hypothetical protein